ncbi:MAG: hypothetical protein M4579_000073 [Chaenotheca gracillima]|nr:MAG: hypothetical protein M4579_000073 [Chaenotheca gracillima]
MERRPKRYLVRWTDDDDRRLLLNIQYACGEKGLKIPWDIVVKQQDKNMSESAIVQHLAKVRKRLLKDKKKVPPPLRKGKPGQSSKTVGSSDVEDEDVIVELTPQRKGAVKREHISEGSDDEYEPSNERKGKGKAKAVPRPKRRRSNKIATIDWEEDEDDSGSEQGRPGQTSAENARDPGSDEDVYEYWESSDAGTEERLNDPSNKDSLPIILRIPKEGLQDFPAGLNGEIEKEAAADDVDHSPNGDQKTVSAESTKGSKAQIVNKEEFSDDHFDFNDFDLPELNLDADFQGADQQRDSRSRKKTEQYSSGQSIGYQSMNLQQPPSQLPNSALVRMNAATPTSWTNDFEIGYANPNDLLNGNLPVLHNSTTPNGTDTHNRQTEYFNTMVPYGMSSIDQSVAPTYPMTPSALNLVGPSFQASNAFSGELWDDLPSTGMGASTRIQQHERELGSGATAPSGENSTQSSFEQLLNSHIPNDYSFSDSSFIGSGYHQPTPQPGPSFGSGQGYQNDHVVDPSWLYAHDHSYGHSSQGLMWPDRSGADGDQGSTGSNYHAGGPSFGS